MSLLHSVYDLLVSRWDFFVRIVLEHLLISLTAVLLAVIFGGLLGVTIAQLQKGDKFVLAVVNFLYTIPAISLLGFLLPITGIGNATAITALFIYALIPMVRNTFSAITSVDPQIIEAARGMGSTELQILTRIKLPLGFPFILTGIRTLSVMTVALAGIASFIGAGGLGVAIYRGITTNQIEMTIAGSLLIALLALLIDGFLGLCEKRVKHTSQAKKRNLNKTEKPRKESEARGEHKTSRTKTFSVKSGSWVLGALVAVVIFASIWMSLGANKASYVRVATKPMTEQIILGNMLKTLIEAKTDVKVEIVQGVGGGTSTIHPAMVNGQFDLYPEYTGTAWNQVLKHQDRYGEEKFSILTDEYKDRFAFQWVGSYGFANSYALAVPRELAQKEHLSKISDIKNISNTLTFGAEYDFFEREDGYKQITSAYGLKFAHTVDLDIGLKYQAMKQQGVDVMTVFTTDGQLANSDLVILEDDAHFYSSYLCGTVVREKVLEEHPQLRVVIESLNQRISNETMSKLNYQVEQEKQDPLEVARNFLKTQKIM